MNKWLQRTVGTASIACGIALAASGVAGAGGDQPTELDKPLGAVDSLGSVTDTGAVGDLAGSVPTDGLPTDSPVGMVPDASQLTGKATDLTGGLPGKKSVRKVTKSSGKLLDGGPTAKTEALPVANGLPAVGGLTQNGLPAVSGLNPVAGNTDLVGDLPVVSNLNGSIAPAAPKPGKIAGKPENGLGMGADIIGSKPLGNGAVGGLRDDVTRPAEDLPLFKRLPAIGQLGSAVPMGNSPLGVDQPDTK